MQALPTPSGHTQQGPRLGRLVSVQRALLRVRRRLRLLRAVQYGVYGGLGGLSLSFAATILYRFGKLTAADLHRTAGLAGGLVLVAIAVGALRRIDPLHVAARIDQSHALNDRVSSALQFAGVGSTPPPSPLGPEAALRELALADAEQVAMRIEPSRAAPFVRPQHLSWLAIGLLATLLALTVRLPRLASPPPTTPPTRPPTAPEARLIVEAELIEPEKDELRRLLDEAEKRGDEEAAAILRELLKLLDRVERGELTRKEAFDTLSELEQRLMQGKDGALEELKERLRKAGNELSEAKLTKELGQALVKEDLAKAQAELKKLASEARTRAESAKEKSDRQAMAQAFERAARGLAQARDKQAEQKETERDRAQAEERARRMQELQEEEKRLKKRLEQNPQDREAAERLKKVQEELDRLRKEAQRDAEQREEERRLKNQKDEWQSSTKSEKDSQRRQELEEEERRLKKKLEENPQDEESERRLKKVKRELENLERERQEREQARRELEQLERDMQRAAEEFQKQLDRMTPEQRKALEKMMEDMQRLQEQLRRMGQGQGQNQQPQSGQGQKGQQGQGQGGRGPVTIALGSIKQVLRRVGRSGQGQGQQGQQGQGQGQQGQGQQGQGAQGQGMSGSMKDFMNRARGQGQGQGQDGDVLIEGEGPGKDGQQTLLLGQGNDPVIIPGMGMGSRGPGTGQGQDGPNGPGSQRPGSDRPGTGHDPNMQGDPTQLDSKRRLSRVYGKEGAGPTRSETILGAAEKGFASQPYRRVYGDYTAVSERAMTQQRVPPGYRFYVKRYFQMIKPRE